MSVTKKIAAMVAVTTGLAAAGRAGAAFTITLSGPTVSGGDSIYNVSALNNGVTTGTTLAGFDSTITTTGSTSATALLIQLSDVDGDGVNDANITGAASSAGSTLNTNSSLFTFQRIGAASNFSVNSASPTPYDTDPNGTGSPTQTINALYTQGNVHTLEISGISTNGGVTDTSTAAIFAHIVVPTGTLFTVSGYVGGNLGLEQAFSVTNTPAISTIVSLSAGSTAPSGFTKLTASGGTATFTPNTPVADSLNVTPRSSGVYFPGYAAVTAAGGVATGSIEASGFSPSSDTEVYALKLDLNGVALSPTASQVQTIVNDINANSATDGVVASRVADSASLSNGYFAGYTILLTSSGSVASQDYVAFDFRKETNVTGLTVTNVAAIPEPASVGVLAAGAVGLLARRRRR
jgi:hypothetical protein